jgi:hypothetical protein
MRDEGEREQRGVGGRMQTRGEKRGTNKRREARRGRKERGEGRKATRRAANGVGNREA